MNCTIIPNLEWLVIGVLAMLVIASLFTRWEAIRRLHRMEKKHDQLIEEMAKLLDVQLHPEKDRRHMEFGEIHSR